MYTITIWTICISIYPYGKYVYVDIKMYAYMTGTVPRKTWVYLDWKMLGICHFLSGGTWQFVGQF